MSAQPDNVVRAALAAFEPRVALAKRKREALDGDSGRPPLSVSVAIDQAHNRLDVAVTRATNDFHQQEDVKQLLDAQGEVIPGKESAYRQLRRSLADKVQALRDQADLDHVFTWKPANSRTTASFGLSTAVAILAEYKALDLQEKELEQERSKAASDALDRTVLHAPGTARTPSPPSSPQLPGTFEALVAAVKGDEAQRRGLSLPEVDGLVADDQLRAFYDLAGGDTTLATAHARVRDSMHQAFQIAHPLPPRNPSPPTSPPTAPVRSDGPPPPPIFPPSPPRSTPPSSEPQAPPPPAPPPLHTQVPAVLPANLWGTGVDLLDDLERPSLRQVLMEFDVSMTHDLTKALSFLARVLHAQHLEPTGNSVADEILRTTKRDALASGSKVLERLDKLQELCYTRAATAQDAMSVRTLMNQARFWEDQRNRWKPYTTPQLFPLFKEVLYLLERARRTSQFVPDVHQLIEYRRLIAAHDAAVFKQASYPSPTSATSIPPPPPLPFAAPATDNAFRHKARSLQLPFWNGNHCLKCNGQHPVLRCPSITPDEQVALRAALPPRPPN